MVAFDAVLWSRFGSRGRQEHHAMKMEDFQLCKNDEGRTAEQEQGFSVMNVLCWRKKVPSCSLQAVCREKTTRRVMVRSFLPRYQNKPKTEWQHLVQNSTIGRKHY